MAGLEDKATFKWATVTGVNPLAIRIDGDTTALALIPDSLLDPISLGVGNRVRVELSLRRVVIHGKANGEGTTSGEVRMTAAAAAPTGWLLCQGQSLLRSQYPTLFSAIGTTYGAADSTRFSLPDLRGRVAVGRDSTQAEFDTLGETGGAKTHTLSSAELPSHTHGLRPTIAEAGGYGFSTNSFFSNRGIITGAADASSDRTGATGGGAAHNNLQPYLTLNYIIKI